MLCSFVVIPVAVQYVHGWESLWCLNKLAIVIDSRSRTMQCVQFLDHVNVVASTTCSSGVHLRSDCRRLV